MYVWGTKLRSVSCLCVLRRAVLPWVSPLFKKSETVNFVPKLYHNNKLVSITKESSA